MKRICIIGACVVLALVASGCSEDVRQVEVIGVHDHEASAKEPTWSRQYPYFTVKDEAGAVYRVGGYAAGIKVGDRLSIDVRGGAVRKISERGW